MRLSEGKKLHGAAEKRFVAVSADTTVHARRRRVEELQRLVAEGRYEVHPKRLAVKILLRAFARSQSGNT